MLEKGIPKRWKIIKQEIKKGCETRKTYEKQKRETEGMPTQARGTLEVPGDTKRSKIEDKLTEEN